MNDIVEHSLSIWLAQKKIQRVCMKTLGENEIPHSVVYGIRNLKLRSEAYVIRPNIYNEKTIENYFGFNQK